MAFTMLTVDGDLMAAANIAGARGRVVATPATSTGALSDGQSALLGAIERDIPDDGQLALELAEGPWRIEILPAPRPGRLPEFQPIEILRDIEADISWGELIGDATLVSDVTPPVLAAAKAVLAPHVPYTPRDTLTGPATDQISAVTTGAGGGYDQAYAPSGGALPADWPLQTYGNMSVNGLPGWVATTSGGQPASVTHRMITDAPSVQLYTYAADANQTYQLELWVDGRPYGSNPITLKVTDGAVQYCGITRVDFVDARPRLVEFRTAAPVLGVYVQKPYRCQKPQTENGPTMVAVGDSIARPIVNSNTAATYAAAGLYNLGAYQQLPKLLGMTKMTTDGRDSTGFIPNNDSAYHYGHADRLAWLTAMNPDVVMVGTLINDVFHGFADDQIVAAAVAYFRTVRGLLPNAKLVLVGGMVLPHPTLSGTNARMKAITLAIQAQLTDLSGVYFLDLFTNPPFDGTGYVTATNGSGNTDIYVGYDKLHPTIRGHFYLAVLLAILLRKVLADNPARQPTISGQLVS